MKTISVLFLGFSLALSLGCTGGGRGYTPTVIPAIGGAWEFIAASSHRPGFQTGIEVNLQQATALIKGVVQETGDLSAAGAQQILVVSMDASQNITFAGNCPGGLVRSINGSVDTNYHVNLTYSDGGNLFSVTAILSSDLKNMTGTYTSQSGSSCTDSGTFTGTLVPKLSGTYTGQLALPDGTTENVGATLSEKSASNFSVNLLISGADNTSLTLAGGVAGNAFAVEGTFQSTLATYYGYYYQTIIQTGVNAGLTQNSVYLVDATDPANLVPAGTLTIPIIPGT
jgi:hypothetical protein